MTKDIKDFIENNYVVLDFESEKLATNAIRLFKSFMSESDEYTKQWSFDLLGNGKYEDGFTNKQGEGVDRETYFQYRPILKEALETKNVDLRSHKEFIEACNLLYLACEEKMTNFIKAIQEEHSIDFLGKIKDFQKDNQHVLRLLCYQDKIHSPVIAEAHTDRSLFTMQIAENIPGLRLGENKELSILEPNTSIVFPGRLAETLDPLHFKAMTHEVTDERIPSIHKEGRWSIVFFSYRNSKPA